MKKVDDEYQCALCGSGVVVPGGAGGAKPETVIVIGDGKAAVRSIMVGGREVHRCELRREPAER